MKLRSNRLIFIFSLFFIVLAACSEDSKNPPPGPEEPFQRQQEGLNIESEILHRDIKYSILFPEGYDKSDKIYPVVYLLHGYGDNETSWMRGGNIRSYADRVVSNGIAEPMIFIAPQGFNTYYVNKYNGKYDYMKMIVEELVPYIDNNYRTRKEKSQRAVMGYSMGGYGAFILPAMNPDVFSATVSLSMSWRTDKQYIAEPQGVFDSQFGSIFGGVGKSGTERLTDYFKSLSPFHFFQQADISQYKHVSYYLDCGDDEEQLSITNDELHILMRDKNIDHEYRMRDGSHTWDYWTGNMNDIFAFLQSSFSSTPFPDEDKSTTVHPENLKGSYKEIAIEGLNGEGGIYLPEEYALSGLSYPVIYFLHDRQSRNISNSIKSVLSLLEDAFIVDGLSQTIVVEIPVSSIGPTFDISDMVSSIDNTYRTIPRESARLLMINGEGGKYAELTSPKVNSYFFYNADINSAKISLDRQFYYMDITDKASPYRAYGELYAKLREEEIEHQYRVRNGTDSYQSFLNGLSRSFDYMNKYLDKPEP